MTALHLSRTHLCISLFQREREITRRQTAKENRSERDDQMEDSAQPDAENEEEKQEELPPIYIPEPPSPLCCGFYSQSGQFWLSMVHTYIHTQTHTCTHQSQSRGKRIDWIKLFLTDVTHFCSMHINSVVKLLLLFFPDRADLTQDICIIVCFLRSKMWIQTSVRMSHLTSCLLKMVTVIPFVPFASGNNFFYFFILET